MNGILWFDNAKNKSLADKIREAAQYFRRRFNHIPELCLVNPNLYANDTGAELEVDVFGEFKVVVRPRHFVLVDHLWIGFEEEPAQVELHTAEVPA